MANTYNSTTLNIQTISVEPSPGILNEVMILPDPTDITANNSILQGVGYKRTVIKVTGWASLTDLGTLLGYKDDNASYNLEIYIGATKHIDLNCIIQELTYTANIADDRAVYTATFIEG